MKYTEKKKIGKKIVAVVLSATMVLGNAGGVIAYAGNYGSLLEQKEIQTTDVTKLTNAKYYSPYLNNEITENYVTYSPNSKVRPYVVYGNDIYGAASFPTVISYAKSAGYNVLAGINGDYFTMSNGVATGMVIKDGILRTSESSMYTSVGFYADGRAIIERSGLATKFHAAGLSSGAHLNKAITLASGPMLYTSDYGATNKAVMPTYNVVVHIEEGEPRINQTMKGVVQSVGGGGGAIPLNKGNVVISIATGTVYTGTLAHLQSLKVGDPVSFTFEANTKWNDVVQAVGGGEKIVTAGNNVAPSSVSGRAPRTAIGIKSDGTTIFYTADGRQTGYSAGATLQELGGRMVELGCVEAVNMDGGGSTALMAPYPGDEKISTINSPSGGMLRNCGNYVLLVSDQPATGDTSYLHIYPYSPVMLAGASQKFTLKATDSSYYPSAVPSDVSYAVSTSSLGTLNETGVFTAGKTAMSGKVNATAGNGATGFTDVTIIDRPDTMTLINAKTGTGLGASISIGAGDSFAFSASATHNKRPLIAQGQCYTWSVTGNIGSVDSNGVFTADPQAKGSGTVTGSIGGKSVSIVVNVVCKGELVEDFEGATNKFTQGDFTTSVNKELPNVHNGKSSLAVAYQSDGSKTQLALPIAMDFAKTPGMTTFWIYGDNSGNPMSLTVKTANGTETVSVGALNFNGWKLMQVNLPKGTTGFSSLNLTPGTGNKGTFYIDQMMVGYGQYVDTQVPTVSGSIKNNILTANVTDNMDSQMKKEQIQVTLDGKSIAFTYDSSSKALTAALGIKDGKTHKVSVKATDISGNVKRESFAVAATTTTSSDGAVLSNDGTPFIDTIGHWSNLFTSYLYHQNIISGKVTAAGRAFEPNVNITRAEFASIVVKWLGTDVNQYANVTLDFADQSSIPTWAIPAVKAVYGSGLMSGKRTNGKLYFGATNDITRQEVMTVIGHTQERGYEEAELTFKDSDKVAAWALPYVKTLVAQKVVSGANGYLLPTDPITRAQVASIIYGLN